MAAVRPAIRGEVDRARRDVTDRFSRPGSPDGRIVLTTRRPRLPHALDVLAERFLHVRLADQREADDGDARALPDRVDTVFHAEGRDADRHAHTLDDGAQVRLGIASRIARALVRAPVDVDRVDAQRLDLR